MHDLPLFHMEFDKNLIRKAFDCAFHYVELHDDIVSTIFATPETMKKIVLAFPDEVAFDYVYQGIGRFRTADLKYLPAARENGIIFLNKQETFKLKLNLI